MTHYPSISSPLPPTPLPFKFIFQTQDSEAGNSYEFLERSLHQLGEWELFIRNFFAVPCYFLSPLGRCSEGRSGQCPAQTSQLSSRFSPGCSTLLCLSVWDSVTWLQQMRLLQFFSQQCSHCCYWNFSCLSPVLIMCRLIPWFWWLCSSINTRHLWASSKRRIISYFWFALLTRLSLYHILQLNIFVNWGILSIL